MLNKSTGNMYDFVTHTWNPIKGKCCHDCSYCYMKRFGEQKPIRIDEKELKPLENLRSAIVAIACIYAEDDPECVCILTDDLGVESIEDEENDS